MQQTHLAGWLGITQGQLIRIERAITPVRDLTKLDQWTRVLHIPGHLLWFEVSPDHPETPACLTLGATLEEADQGKSEEGDGVRRRELLKVAKAAGVSAVTGSGLLADAPWQRLRDSLDKARPVDAATVQLMQDRTADFFETEYTVPARDVLDLLTTHHATLTTLIGNARTDTTRDPLTVMIGETQGGL